MSRHTFVPGKLVYTQEHGDHEVCQVCGKHQGDNWAHMTSQDVFNVVLWIFAVIGAVTVFVLGANWILGFLL